MAAMRAVGNGHRLPVHARVRESDAEYRIELAIPEFVECELEVEALGQRLTVRGDQAEVPEDEGKAFRLHERLEESFRLPDDADPDRVRAFYRHGTLEIRAPRTRLASRSVPVERRSTYLVNPDAEGC
jgi:HSP20 family molecular chaperone IbpA